ncbi:MAG: phosphotransferase [Chitinophagaceae bacterium]
MHNDCTQWLLNKGIVGEEAIVQAGSDRQYKRLLSPTENYIWCHNEAVDENETFFYFTQHFAEYGIPVPNLLMVSSHKKEYILSDGGRESLLDVRLRLGETDAVYVLYEQALQHLVRMQIPASATLNFSRCYAQGAFDADAVMHDLHYFETYYWEALFKEKLPSGIQPEFERLAQRIAHIPEQYFMYRDFQGRNILVNNNALCFIDFQGGMRGPLSYDVASLLWQAKASLSIAWKEALYAGYKKEVQQFIAIDEARFDEAYRDVVLVRLLQVLGAYGRRGILERKPHFLSSIPQGLHNIQTWLSMYSLVDAPVLASVLQTILNHPPHVDTP